MKIISTVLFALLFVTSCHQSPKNIVSPSFADSLILNYQPSEMAQAAEANRVFWQGRMDSLPDNFVTGPKYAAALSSCFHLYGDIKDLCKADSLMKESNKANQGKEPGILRTLVSMAMLQHQFHQADSFLRKATQIDGRNIANTYLDFDVAFESGDMTKAKSLLKILEKDNSYGYLFRRSKYEHAEGSLDSAISYMILASEKNISNKYMRQAAISNAADLSMHKGNLSKAYSLYLQSIAIDGADFHSILGLGWIALVADKNDTLAEKIFQFVHKHNTSPDVLLRLEQIAEARNNSTIQKQYATEFVIQASKSNYGKMYNKYLIDLFTGILNKPGKAVILAEQEVINRPTTQVYAWYAWSLFCNNQKDKAYGIFKNFVSNKPLEGLELYYMGKMMQGIGKGYNAQLFFKAAYKNRYDLSPAKVKDLKESLE